jgi:hypothetical protein
MSGKQAKRIRKKVGLDKDPTNKILKRIYKREKKNYSKLNWKEKTNE